MKRRCICHPSQNKPPSSSTSTRPPPKWTPRSPHRQIELLQEYRTRLIADVVTGKLDVREAAAQLPDESDDQDQLQEGGPLGDGMYEDLHAPGEFAEELAMPSNMP